MENFEIKLSSWINFFVTYILLIPLVFIIGTKLFSGNTTTLIVLTGIFVILLYYVTKFTATVLTIWTINQKSIHVSWTKPILFHRQKSDRTIMWEEIKAYKLSSDKIFDRFKLVLKDGTVLKFWHDVFITKDDYNKFITYFIGRVEEHNKKETDKETEIKDVPEAKEWTLNKTLFRVFAYPFCLFLIGLGIFAIIQPRNYKSISAGVGGICISIFYLYTDLKILIRRNKACR